MEYNSPPFKENERLGRLAIKYNNRENRESNVQGILLDTYPFLNLQTFLSEVEKTTFCMTIAYRIILSQEYFLSLKMKMRNRKSSLFYSQCQVV